MRKTALFVGLLLSRAPAAFAGPSFELPELRISELTDFHLESLAIAAAPVGLMGNALLLTKGAFVPLAVPGLQTNKLLMVGGATDRLTNPVSQARQQSVMFDNAAAMLGPGSVIAGKYTVGQLLGTGGAFRVHQGVRVEDGAPVAIKELHPFSSALERAAGHARLRREHEILSQLNHPDFPRVHDFYEDANPLLIMDLIEGRTLEERLQEDPALPAGVVLDLGEQLLESLNVLHSQNPPILHRDLKPKNVILRKSGGGALIDFDQAVQTESPIYRDDSPMLTPGYAAPEQLYGFTSVKTDLYALSAILHQALTGTDPAEHAFRFPPVENVSDQAAQVIAQAVALSSEERFESAPQMLEALRAARTNGSAQRHTTAPTNGTSRRDQQDSVIKTAAKLAESAADDLSYLPLSQEVRTAYRLAAYIAALHRRGISRVLIPADIGELYLGAVDMATMRALREEQFTAHHIRSAKEGLTWLDLNSHQSAAIFPFRGSWWIMDSEYDPVDTLRSIDWASYKDSPPTLASTPTDLWSLFHDLIGAPDPLSIGLRISASIRRRPSLADHLVQALDQYLGNLMQTFFRLPTGETTQTRVALWNAHMPEEHRLMEFERPSKIQWRLNALTLAVLQLYARVIETLPGLPELETTKQLFREQVPARLRRLYGRALLGVGEMAIKLPGFIVSLLKNQDAQDPNLKILDDLDAAYFETQLIRELWQIHCILNAPAPRQ